MRKFKDHKKLGRDKLNDQHSRLRELAYNLLVASEAEDVTAIEQTAGELRGWFDLNGLKED